MVEIVDMELTYKIKEEPDYSYTVIKAGDKQTEDFEIYYQGKRVTNVIELTLYGIGIMHEGDLNIEIVTKPKSWKKEMEANESK